MVISIYLLCLGNIEMHFLCLYSFLVLSLGPFAKQRFLQDEVADYEHLHSTKLKDNKLD